MHSPHCASVKFNKTASTLVEEEGAESVRLFDFPGKQNKMQKTYNLVKLSNSKTQNNTCLKKKRGSSS